MDNTLRDLERQLKQSPDDPALLSKVVQARIRSGSGVSKSFYKIRNKNGQHLSANAYPPMFTSSRTGGSNYINRNTAVKAIQKAYQQAEEMISRHYSVVECKSFLAECADCTIIKYQTATIELEAEPLNIAAEMKRIALEDIRKQRVNLEKKEQALLKEEQALLKEIEPKASKKRATN